MNSFILSITALLLTGCISTKSVSYSKSDHIELDYNLTIFTEKNFKIDGNIVLDNDFNYCNGMSKTMGVELFRLKTTVDSIFFIDRYNRQYYKGLKSNDSINNQTLMLVSNIDLVFNSWKYISKGDTSVFATNSNVLSYSTTKIDNNNVLDIILKNRRLSIIYKNIDKKRNFPTLIDLTLFDNSGIVKMSVVIDGFFKSNTIPTDIKISKKYKPII